MGVRVRVLTEEEEASESAGEGRVGDVAYGEVQARVPLCVHAVPRRRRSGGGGGLLGRFRHKSARDAVLEDGERWVARLMG